MNISKKYKHEYVCCLPKKFRDSNHGESGKSYLLSFII